MLNDPHGREQLLQLGVRNVPVVAKGSEFVFGQNLEDVAEFVGLHGTGHTPLPPAELMKKWINVLHAAQRYMRQLPPARLGERVIDNRDRSIRLMCHHIFRIGEAFLETVNDGVEYNAPLATIPPKDGTCTTGDEIARYGDTVIARLREVVGCARRQVLRAESEHLLRRLRRCTCCSSARPGTRRSTRGNSPRYSSVSASSRTVRLTAGRPRRPAAA